MPTTTSGLYELVLESSASGQPMKSVFHYLTTLGQDDMQEEVADSFDATIMSDLAGILNSNISFDNIRVANLTGVLADWNLTPSQGSGDVIGSNMAAFTAASYVLNRTTKETRNGAKRFPGMVEENVNGASFTGPYFTALEAFAIVLASQITGGGVNADLVILRKPDILGVWLYNDVANAQALNRLTTQNSRKNF